MEFRIEGVGRSNPEFLTVSPTLRLFPPHVRLSVSSQNVFQCCTVDNVSNQTEHTKETEESTCKRGDGIRRGKFHDNLTLLPLLRNKLLPINNIFILSL